MTILDAKKYCTKELSHLYPNHEINSIFELIIEFLLNYSKTTIHLNNDTELIQNDLDQFSNIVSELKKGKPIQYILGETEFYDLIFQVDHNVLIPRQETEELVRYIYDNLRNDVSQFLDIGTGSGCIAIALKDKLSSAKAFACDISHEALKIAENNANRNGVPVEFFHYDILKNNETHARRYDLIVSNPPYVTNSEKSQMHANVLDYEPDLALFVDDNQALIYYKAITAFAQKHLSQSGKLIVEINEKFGEETLELFITSGFCNTKLIKDINSKDRFVYGEK